MELKHKQLKTESKIDKIEQVRSKIIARFAQKEKFKK